MDKLEGVKVPGTDKKLAQWVKPREDIYSGPYVSEAPEILFNSLEGDNCHGGIVGYGQIMFFQSLKVFSRKIHPGHHRRNGLLLALGPRVQNKERNASIMDIAPTILNLLSLPIPKQIDGEVIGEIAPTKPEFARPNDFYQGSTRKVESINKQEDEEKKKALKNMGYM
jgi:predicted AlkP superfamily phosphohydrolase/phosphomutase